MSNLEMTVLFAAIFVTYAVALYLDHRYNLRIIDWCNGKSASPFARKNAKQTTPVNTQNQTEQIKVLKERIQVLEKIVTEPAYELDQKINALK